MELNDEKVEFDLSVLSLEELVEVYKNISSFLDFLRDNKINMEEE